MRKRRLFILLGVLAVLLASGLVLAGCASTNDLGIYDSTAAKSQLCTIIIDRNVTIDTMDGDTVHWGYWVDGKVKVSIPAGSHDFVSGALERKRGAGDMAGAALFGNLGTLASQAADIASRNAGYAFSYTFSPQGAYEFKVKSNGLGFGKNTIEVRPVRSK
jgi:hypothetical protein